MLLILLIQTGPKPDSPVSSSQQSLRSLLPVVVNKVEMSPQQQQTQTSGSDVDIPTSSLAISNMISKYGQASEECFDRRTGSTPVNQPKLQLSRLPLPDGDGDKSHGMLQCCNH